MSSIYDLMVAHPFLAGLPAPYVERLSHWASRAPFEAGTRIFEEHGQAERWWLIRDGYVNLDTRLPGRGDVIVETLGPGSVLGWSWLFPRTGGISARSPSARSRPSPWTGPACAASAPPTRPSATS
ncbi:cyclic nucleotide-binding domain-containing protein [Dactylosporangium cerinum]